VLRVDEIYNKFHRTKEYLRLQTAVSDDTHSYLSIFNIYQNYTEKGRGTTKNKLLFLSYRYLLNKIRGVSNLDVEYGNIFLKDGSFLFYQFLYFYTRRNTPIIWPYNHIKTRYNNRSNKIGLCSIYAVLEYQFI